MIEKQYTGEAYIGVVGPEVGPFVCRESIERIARRDGDLPPKYVYATKGYEARQLHINNFLYETRKDWLLLLDHDQYFPQDTLERLRRHGQPYVSGFYMRRSIRPMCPVWFYPFDGTWPMKPYAEKPEPGKLHELGASGWGCILVHREVLETVRDEVLRGEDMVLEDDMDVWPYDLANVMEAIGTLRALVEERPKVAVLRPALESVYRVLAAELRPLRGVKHPMVGSDIRFPFFAKAAGYTLWGDPDVRCGHNIQYELSPNDWAQTPDEQIAAIAAKFGEAWQAEHDEIMPTLARLEDLAGGTE